MASYDLVRFLKNRFDVLLGCQPGEQLLVAGNVSHLLLVKSASEHGEHSTRPAVPDMKADFSRYTINLLFQDGFE